MNGRILVAGIGNIFLGDDGFGVEVVNRLATHTLPDCVRVVDFGIRSYDLAYALMEAWDLVILVDALPGGGKPGTIYTVEPDLPERSAQGVFEIDAHMMNPESVLRMASALGGKLSRTLVVGCEPATVECDEESGFGLSEAVQAAVDEAVRVVEEIVYQNMRATAA
ncbi:MAG TPA: hydrogenase maturation protease [candidate division Zixibacteria bacterium]|nr:hydrogenase maturation protease [candidate division Zixibacteria bacterium]